MTIENSLIESKETRKVIHKLLSGKYKKHPYSAINSRFLGLRASDLRSVLRDQKRLRDKGVDKVLEHMLNEKYLLEVRTSNAPRHFAVSEWYMKSIEALMGKIPAGLFCDAPEYVFRFTTGMGKPLPPPKDRQYTGEA